MHLHVSNFWSYENVVCNWRQQFHLAVPIFFCLTVSVLGTIKVEAAVISADWRSGVSGNWSNAANWSPAGVPNNGANTYEVTIDVIFPIGDDVNTPYTVTLNSDVTIDEFVLDWTDATLSHSAGTFRVLDEAELRRGTFRQSGGTLAGGTWIQNGGSLVFSGTSILDGATLMGDLNLTSGGGQVTVRLQNGAMFTGNANLGGFGNMDRILSFEDALTLDNRTINLERGGVLGVGGTNMLTLGPGTFLNLTGANARLGSDLASQFGTGTIVNQGTITVGGTASARTINPDIFDNLGTVEVTADTDLAIGGSFANRGNLIISAGTVQITGDFTHRGTAVLLGSGTVQASNFINEAMVRPGNSPGILTITGDYTQTADGVLEIEVGGYNPGTEHDQLQVTNTASLAGRLEVPILEPFNPSGGPILGQKIDFLSATTRTGEFSAVVSPNLEVLYPGVAIDVTYLADGAQLSFVPTQTNIVFDDTSGATPSWFSLGTWENTAEPMNDLVPSLANDVTLTTTAIGNPEVSVSADNALVAKLSIGGSASQPLTIKIGDGVATGTGNLSSTTGVSVLQNATVALDQGTLATSDVTINGGTLTGSGFVDLSSNTSAGTGTLTVTNGTISPGFSVGHVDIDGNLELASGSELVIEIDGATQFDTIDITGEATLGGTLTVMTSDAALSPGMVFEVVTAGSLTDGAELDDVEVIGTDDYYFRLQYGDEELQLLSTLDGDMNGMGGVTDDDIPFFALALRNPEAYINHPTMIMNGVLEASDAGDMDDNGRLDFDDIDEFAIATGRTPSQLIEYMGQLQSVPEPAGLVLALLFSISLGARVRIRDRQFS